MISYSLTIVEPQLPRPMWSSPTCIDILLGSIVVPAKAHLCRVQSQSVSHALGGEERKPWCGEKLLRWGGKRFWQHHITWWPNQSCLHQLFETYVLIFICNQNRVCFAFGNIQVSHQKGGRRQKWPKIGRFKKMPRYAAPCAAWKGGH